MLKRPVTLFALSLCLLSSCSDSALVQEVPPTITVIFYDNRLGDMGYCDDIYSGICRVYEEYSSRNQLALNILTPYDTDISEQIIDDWFKKNKKSRELLILTNSDALQHFKEHPEWASTPGAEILLLDCDDASVDLYTRKITMYGVSYLAGGVVKGLGLDDVALIAANNRDKPIVEGVKGFLGGFRSAGGSVGEDDIYFLAEGNGEGYSVPNDTYRLSYDLWKGNYSFVFPICGGSNLGVFRYARDYESSYGSGTMPFYTCGMDVDQQIMSSSILFSVVKKYDLLLEDFIRNWLANENIEKHKTLMIDSEYADVIISDGFSGRIPQDEVNRIKAVAIEAEKKYYSQ